MFARMQIGSKKSGYSERRGVSQGLAPFTPAHTSNLREIGVWPLHVGPIGNGYHAGLGALTGGGPANLGTIFTIGVDGIGFRLLHSFVGGSDDGAGPTGDLLISGGNFYGMTSAGGSANDGLIFSIPVSERSAFLLVGTAIVFFGVGRRR
jgi:uncharacterized repeat protein (TIGR03803 family)